MRNLKKLLAVIVAICVLASFTVPAFAATSASFTYADQAKKLYDMKLYAGNSATSYVPDLGSKLTREQGIILLVRMFGKEKDALAMTDADTVLAKYTDAAKVSSWAKKYVAYAVKTTMVSGTTATTLDAAGKLTGNAMATMILKNLGFTVDPATYATNAATLSSKGGLTADEATKFASKELIRDDVVGIMFGSLKAKDSNGKVVIDNLVASGAVSADAAKAAGVYTSVALDVSSAVAINSKVVEVSLGTAATAADVAGATFAVKDSAGKALNVKSAALAAYNTDSKAIIITLDADTTVGTLYTLTVGSKSVNFGGKAVDTGKPTVSGTTSTDYNKVKITFSEPIKLDGAVVVLAEKYGAKTALTVSNIAYSGKDAIEVTTADQKASTLYSVEVSSVTDFAGNAMDKSTDKTFVGTAKPTESQTVSAAKAIDYNKVYVEFSVKVDPTQISTATVKVEEMYGTKTAIAGTAAAATEADAKLYGYTSSTNPTAADAAKKAIVINLTGELKASTLYKVTVTGLGTLYGKAMSSTDTDTYKTFVGMAKPASDSMTVNTPTATSNTTISVGFANKVDKATAETVANYTIAEAYGNKAALTVSKAEVDGDDSTGKTVKLTVAAMKNILYKLTVANVKDIYGNTVKTSGDANIVTFVGVNVAGKIDTFSALVDSADNTKLVLTFSTPVDSTAAKDVSHYLVDNGIGYPSSASVDTTKLIVTLIIPKTVDGKIYKIKVTGLPNADGVAMDAAGVEKTFTGRGVSSSLPEMQAVLASDAQTLKIYFDRDVTDSTIDGKIWTSSTKTLVANKLYVAPDGTTFTALDTYAGVKAYQDSTNKNVLVVRTTNTAAFTKATATTTDDTFKMKADKNVIKPTDSSDTVLVFAYNDTAVTKVVIDNVMALNRSTIRLYFNQAVRAPQAANNAATDFAKINTLKDGTGANITLSNAIAADSTNTIWDFKTSANMAKQSYFLIVLPTVSTTELSDIVGSVTAKDEDSAATSTQQVREFAGSDAAPSAFTSVYGIMTDKRTVDVYFPEAMDATTATDITRYAINSANDGAVGTQLTTPVISADQSDDKTKVTLHLGANIANNKNYLVISSAIQNSTLTNGVKADKTGMTGAIASGIVVELANSTTDASRPAIAGVTLDDDRMGLTIKMDRVVAFDGSTATLAITAGPNAVTDDEFPTTGDTMTSFDQADFAKVFTINAKLVGDSAASDLAINASTVIRNVDGKSFHVTFSRALAASSEGYVTTKNADNTLYMYDRSNVAAGKISDNESKVTFGVPATTSYGAPTAVSATLYDGTTNLAKAAGVVAGNGDYILVTFNKAIASATVSTAATVASCDGLDFVLTRNTSNTALDTGTTWTASVLNSTTVKLTLNVVNVADNTIANAGTTAAASDDSITVKASAIGDANDASNVVALTQKLTLK